MMRSIVRKDAVDDGGGRRPRAEDDGRERRHAKPSPHPIRAAHDARCDGPATSRNPGRPPAASMHEKTPRDIAKQNAREYREPGRDLTATKPTPEGGDEDNPRAREHTHGAGGDAPLGSDERARLVKRKR